MNILHVKKLSADAILPSKAHSTDGAFDLSTNQSFTLPPGQRHTFTTGLAAEFSPQFLVLLRDRSSLGSQGIQVLAGVIDASYREEWKVVLHNTAEQAYEIKAGDRIAQCLLLPVPDFAVQEIKELSATDRGDGGFGSSGR